jgi:aspartate aminotransferase-like enzyme
MDDWGLDVVLTASQKGLGTPPGLSVVLVSQKAMKVRLCQSEGTTAEVISAGIRVSLNARLVLLCELGAVCAHSYAQLHGKSYLSLDGYL